MPLLAGYVCSRSETCRGHEQLSCGHHELYLQLWYEPLACQQAPLLTEVQVKSAAKGRHATGISGRAVAALSSACSSVGRHSCWLA